MRQGGGGGRGRGEEVGGTEKKSLIHCACA